MNREGGRVLATRKLSPEARFVQPTTFKPVSADSPAIEVMTDLRLVSAATIDPGASIDRATETMVLRGVRLLFVVRPEPGLLGIITARDTLGERPMQLLQTRGGRHEELTVADLMREVREVDVVELSDVLRAQVADVVATLRDQGRQHMLVAEVDALTRRQQVRGIFSLTQIGRQLGVPVHAFEVAQTFAEIEAVLAH